MARILNNKTDGFHSSTRSVSIHFMQLGSFLDSESIRKPLKFCCFQGVLKERSCSKWVKENSKNNFQPTFTCSKLRIETLEKSVKYVQS